MFSLVTLFFFCFVFLQYSFAYLTTQTESVSQTSHWKKKHLYAELFMQPDGVLWYFTVNVTEIHSNYKLSLHSELYLILQHSLHQNRAPGYTQIMWFVLKILPPHSMTLVYRDLSCYNTITLTETDRHWYKRSKIPKHY